jgi:hypothetical protein
MTLKKEAQQEPVAVERAMPIPIPLTLIYLSKNSWRRSLMKSNLGTPNGTTLRFRLDLVIKTKIQKKKKTWCATEHAPSPCPSHCDASGPGSYPLD